jgi:hypothetical protein
MLSTLAHDLTDFWREQSIRVIAWSAANLKTRVIGKLAMGDRLVLVIYASRHGLACFLAHQGDDSSLAVIPLILWPRLCGMFEHFTGHRDERLRPV